jgi:hypothetical protein
LLFKAFSPGLGTPGQVFEVDPGAVTIGVNEKPWHHEGGGNLPARPYWPKNGNLPGQWWGDMLDIAVQGAMALVRRVA